MHGYERNNKTDINRIYNTLFDQDILNDCYVDTTDIIKIGEEFDLNTCIIDNSKFTLLNQTLQHNLTYLYLCLLVEKELVEKKKIDKNSGSLGDILNYIKPEHQTLRIKLMSKKLY